MDELFVEPAWEHVALTSGVMVLAAAAAAWGPAVRAIRMTIVEGLI